MNSNKKIYGERRNLAHKWRELFRRRRGHDPMLVFNMSIFNSADGWNRIFNPLKVYENGTR
jgi:hypothetical protein